MYKLLASYPFLGSLLHHSRVSQLPNNITKAVKMEDAKLSHCIEDTLFCDLKTGEPANYHLAQYLNANPDITIQTFISRASDGILNTTCENSENNSLLKSTARAAKAAAVHEVQFVNAEITSIINDQTQTTKGPCVTREAQQHPVPQPLTVVVEGNIGSGKTTFLKHFNKLPNFCVVDEPIDKWRDCQGHNLLDLMYKDPVKWSCCFQSYVQLTMLDLHTKRVSKPVKMMERSIYSAKHCFVTNLKEQGLLNEAEYIVLSEWFDFIQKTIPLKVDLIVYLKTDPEVVYERIAARGRSEEDSISLSYLKSIHKLHEDWLFHHKFGPVPPVITIDANEDLSQMLTKYSMCEKTIIQKVAVSS